MKTNPEDVFEQIFDDSKTTLPVQQKLLTPSTAKLDDGVKTVEDRVLYWQKMINHWRITIAQNEQVIIIFCIIFGLAYSYAINECTGNFNLPVYVYAMSIGLVFMASLLLIAEGGLPLLVLVKFGVSIATGHVAMMFLIAVDGHYWKLFVTDVCRYPVTTDSIMVFIVGGGAGYIFAKFEEIRSAGGIE